MADEPRTCFIIMPVSTPKAWADFHNDTDHFKHVLEHLFVPAVKKAEFEPILPVSRGSNVIHGDIINNLLTADLVLCDRSAANPNVLFELGIRTALDKPVALVADFMTRDQTPPFDIGSINTHFYDASLTLWTAPSQIDSLAEHIKAADRESKGRNSMWRYFAIETKGELKPETYGLDDWQQAVLISIESLRQEVSSLRQSQLQQLGGLPQGLPRGLTATVPSSRDARVPITDFLGTIFP